MIGLSDHTADLLVGILSEEEKRLKKVRTHPDLRGPRHAHGRRRFLRLEKEMGYAISAINTGEGLTRRSAYEEISR